MATVRARKETGTRQGKSQARLEDLTLRKNHHTPSQALGGGGGGCPSALCSSDRKGVGVWGACWPHGFVGGLQEPHFSIMPLPHSVSMQARGWEGSLSPSLPL